MTRICLLLFAALCSVSCSSSKKGWKLQWKDEFNYTGLPDSTKWDYETGGHGWGNNEKQFYTKADTGNAFVQDGKLFIKAKKQTAGNNLYTSARLVTRNRRSFLYGRIEVKAKLPQGRGTWPAIWMLGNNIDTAGWPGCGEIDIMEHVGYMPDSVFGSVHTKSFNHVIHTQRTKGIYTGDPYTAFHVYGIEWGPEKITFFMDDKTYLIFSNLHQTVNEWPFSKPFFLLLNIAVGGNWGGVKGIDENVFPAVMEVEYVRVYAR